MRPSWSLSQTVAGVPLLATTGLGRLPSGTREPNCQCPEVQVAILTAHISGSGTREDCVDAAGAGERGWRRAEVAFDVPNRPEARCRRPSDIGPFPSSCHHRVDVLDSFHVAGVDGMTRMRRQWAVPTDMDRGTPARGCKSRHEPGEGVVARIGISWLALARDRAGATRQHTFPPLNVPQLVHVDCQA